MKSVILDTNLLLLLVVGETDRKMIGRHKRLTAYQDEDFVWVRRLISSSQGLLFCPNIVSETSNLIRYAPKSDAVAIAYVLKAMLEQFPEQYLPSQDATRRVEYDRLGITDAVLLVLAENNARLVTDDLDLALAAAYAEADVINYNHIRDNR